MQNNTSQTSRNWDRRWCIYSSNSLLKTDRSDIGLQFDLLVASPLLKIGITLAILSLSGKVPVRKDSLTKTATSFEMGRSRLIGILFGPLDLPFSKD